MTSRFTASTQKHKLRISWLQRSACAETNCVFFVPSNSEGPCGRRQRSWGVGRRSQPLLCSTRLVHASIATLDGSSKRARPSPKHQTSTTWLCFTGTETGSAGWDHAAIIIQVQYSNWFYIRLLVGLFSVYSHIVIFIPRCACTVKLITKCNSRSVTWLLLCLEISQYNNK